MVKSALHCIPARLKKKKGSKNIRSFLLRAAPFMAFLAFPPEIREAGSRFDRHLIIESINSESP